MLDEMLTVMAAMDWISPLLALIGNVLNSPSYTFLIPYDCGWSGREVISLLRRNGIKTWGHMVVSGTLMISVRLGQAEWAQYLLDHAAIPVENRASAAQPPMPQQVSQREVAKKLRTGLPARQESSGISSYSDTHIAKA